MKNKKIIIVVVLVVVIIVIGMLLAKSSDAPAHDNTLVTSEEDIEQNTQEIDEIIVVDDSDVEIVEKETATYEQWLASAMIIALTLYEEDVQVEKILYNSEQSLDKKMDSSGVYVFYTAGGENACIYSNAIESERDFEGKVDLYTSELGFASFDKVNVALEELSEWKEIEIDSLDSIIAQSMLVSLYEN